MSAEKPKGINTGRIVSIFVGVALVSALAFFIYKYYNEKNRNEEQALNIDGLTTEIEDLESDLDNYRLDLENKDLDLEEKERLLAEKEQLLVEKQKKIDDLVRNNKITRSQAEKLKGKVEQLEYYIRKYQAEIDDLREQVEGLTEDKRRLASRLDTVTGKMQNLARAKEETDFKLQAASILNAFSFSHYRIKSNGKAIPDTEFRRGQMDHYQTCFSLMENIAAERGQRDVYIQIKDPSGNVIKDMDGQSGYFKFQDEDQAYTMKTAIDYDRTTQKLCVKFKKPDNYDYGKGKHSIVVFCDGYDIGTSNFIVK